MSIARIFNHIARTFAPNVLTIWVNHGANILVPKLCAVKFPSNNIMTTYEVGIVRTFVLAIEG